MSALPKFIYLLLKGPGQNHIQGAGPDIEASLVSQIGDRTRGGPSPALGDVLTDILYCTYSTYIPPRGNESTSINPTGKETKSVYYASVLSFNQYQLTCSSSVQ